jgi:hypothetical protein
MSGRRDHEELEVIAKTYDLILRSCHHTSKFPRNHRFVLGERIERNLYDLLETLIRAKYNRNRHKFLEQANLVLKILRFQMRLAKDLQCFKVESYGFAAKAIEEIGGWPKSSGSKARSATATCGNRSLASSACWLPLTRPAKTGGPAPP